VSLPFDPTDYVKTRAPVVDSFTYEASDPETKSAIRVDLNEEFLRRTAETMNRRDASGNPCPIVIGHTRKGEAEKYQPPKVGYLHNYTVEPYDGRPTLWADHYIKREVEVPLNGVLMKLSAREVAERFPRRSGEIWYGTYEVDPHSLLGATTPHRNLGLLKLSSDGNVGYSYSSPGELKVADELKAPQTGDLSELKALVQQCLAMVGQLTETIHAALQPQAGAEHGGEGGEGGDSLDDFMKSLESEGGEGGEEEDKKGDKKEDKKGDKKPEAEPKPEPKEDEEKVKLQRERDEALIKLARTQITARIAAAGGDTKDEQLISDLLVQPEDVRERMLVRLERGSRPNLPSRFDRPGALTSAVSESTDGQGKRISSAQDQAKVLKLARDEGLLFEQAAKKLGFTLPG